MTGLVDALQSEGSAWRLPRPQDRQVVSVELTGTGAATVVQMQRQRGKDAAALVGGLAARCVEALRSSLDTILIRRPSWGCLLRHL